MAEETGIPLTGSAEGYATPEEIAQARLMARSLMSGKDDQRVYHWTQGVSNMMGALSGIVQNRRANEMERRRNAGLGTSDPDYTTLTPDEGTETSDTEKKTPLNGQTSFEPLAQDPQAALASNEEEPGWAGRALVDQARAMSRSPQEFIQNLARLEEANAPKRDPLEGALAFSGQPVVSDAPALPGGIPLPKKTEAPAEPAPEVAVEAEPSVAPPYAKDFAAPKEAPEAAPEALPYDQVRPQGQPSGQSQGVNTQKLYQMMRQHERTLVSRYGVPPAQAALIARNSAERFLATLPKYKLHETGQIERQPLGGPPTLGDTIPTHGGKPVQDMPGVTRKVINGENVYVVGKEPRTMNAPPAPGATPPTGAQPAAPESNRAVQKGQNAVGVPVEVGPAAEPWQSHLDKALSLPRPDPLSTVGSGWGVQKNQHDKRLDVAADAGKEANKINFKSMENLNNAGAMADQLAPQLAELKAIAANPNLTTGMGADIQTTLKRLITAGQDAFGIQIVDPKTLQNLNDQTTLNQMFQKIVDGGVLQSMRTYLGPNSGPLRVAEIDLVQGAWPKITQNRQSIQEVIGLIEKLNNRVIQERDMMSEFTNKNQGLIDSRFYQASREFRKANPVTTAADLDRISKLGNGSGTTSLPQGPGIPGAPQVKTFWESMTGGSKPPPAPAQPNPELDALKKKYGLP
jgi:hypothetical protein